MEDSRSGRHTKQESAKKSVAAHDEEHASGTVTPAESGPEFYSDVDDASEASFPASDPPAWMGVAPGGPERS